jgi:hypothetical protein
MAEQTGRQEQKQERAPERPQTRKVRFNGGVFLDQSREELDLEGQWARANGASVELYAGKGLLVRYVKMVAGKPVPDAVWVPEGMIRQAHVAPEWKP